MFHGGRWAFFVHALRAILVFFVQSSHSAARPQREGSLDLHRGFINDDNANDDGYDLNNPEDDDSLWWPGLYQRDRILNGSDEESWSDEQSQLLDDVSDKDDENISYKAFQKMAETSKENSKLENLSQAFFKSLSQVIQTSFSDGEADGWNTENHKLFLYNSEEEPADSTEEFLRTSSLSDSLSESYSARASTTSTPYRFRREDEPRGRSIDINSYFNSRSDRTPSPNEQSSGSRSGRASPPNEQPLTRFAYPNSDNFEVIEVDDDGPCFQDCGKLLSFFHERGYFDEDEEREIILEALRQRDIE